MSACLSRPTPFSFFAVVLFLALQVPANAATCVPATADGPGLQSCLDTIAPGDTILLSQGTYTGPPGIAFLIDKSLTIKGTNDVVLSGGNSGHVVVIVAPAGSPVGSRILLLLTAAALCSASVAAFSQGPIKS